jgi:putative membrane protein
VREAINRLLPVASIGGEIVGVRLVCWRLPDGTLVTASIIVEVLVTMAVQYVFSACGLVLVIGSMSNNGEWMQTAVLGLLLSLPVPVIAAILLRRGGIFHAIERWATRMPILERLPIDGKRLDSALSALMERPSLLLQTFLWQLSGYVVGAFEVWFALDLLGHPVSIVEAIAVEALTQAVRHAAFFIPGGLGVQEATLLLLAQMFGVPYDAALSLALVKRVREIVFGCLALGSWQWAEIRRARTAS